VKTGQWRKLHNVELHNLFSSLVIVIRNTEVVIRVRTYLHVWRYENDGIQERIFVP